MQLVKGGMGIWTRSLWYQKPCSETTRYAVVISESWTSLRSWAELRTFSPEKYTWRHGQNLARGITACPACCLSLLDLRELSLVLLSAHSSSKSPGNPPNSLCSPHSGNTMSPAPPAPLRLVASWRHPKDTASPSVAGVNPSQQRSLFHLL